MTTMENVRKVRKETLDRLECAETEEEKMKILSEHYRAMVKLLKEEGIL